LVIAFADRPESALVVRGALLEVVVVIEAINPLIRGDVRQQVGIHNSEGTASVRACA
jgi:hypothetical protein